VFGPLARQRHRLAPALLDDLLDAFSKTWPTALRRPRRLLDYCRRSANPVGRLLLHLYGVDDAPRAAPLRRHLHGAAADQLLAGPEPRRPARPLYLPQADLQRHGVSGEQLLRCATAPPPGADRELCDWARALMREGAPLAHPARPQRLGMRLVVQGGLRILAKIAAMDYASLTQRPALTAWDWPRLLWRAARCGRVTPEQYVQQKAAASGSSFYYAFLFLPPPRRAAITAFYAFCREVDDVVDETQDAGVAATKLAWWRKEVASAGRPSTR
jgi:phytoene/squalene synthetase